MFVGKHLALRKPLNAIIIYGWQIFKVIYVILFLGLVVSFENGYNIRRIYDMKKAAILIASLFNMFLIWKEIQHKVKKWK